MVLLAVVGGGGLLAYSVASSFSAGPGVEETTAIAVRQDFQVTVIEDGNLESAKNVDVKCQVAGGSSILWIVGDGSFVEKDAEIVRLDSSLLEDQINQQKNTFEKARAAKIQAEKDYQIAMISVDEYLKGTFEQDLQEAERLITIAEENLRSAQNGLDFSGKMFRKGYLSKLELESQQFNVKRAELELASANTTKTVLVTYTKEKTKEDLLSKVETSKAKMDSETAAFALEESRLNRLEAQLANCIVKAPQAGMVVYANETGSRFGGQSVMIEEGASVREQQTLVRLPDLSQMQVKVLVHESKVEQIRIGQRAIVSLLGKQYQGEVISVANQPEPSSFFSAGTKEYATIVKIEGENAKLKPGMTAETTILIDRVEDALTIPIAAVVQHNRKLLCWVKQGSGYEKRELEIGQSNDEVIEIISGLKAGEVVLKNPKRFVELEAAKDDNSGNSDNFGTSKNPAAGSPENGAGGSPGDGKGGDGKRGDGKRGEGKRPEGAPTGSAENGSGGGAGGARSGGGNLMSNDKDGDGKVSKEEAPEFMKSFFDRLDTNSDGFVDQAEMDAARRQREAGQ
jgi:RND family efflux transporter MFP subunit